MLADRAVKVCRWRMAEHGLHFGYQALGRSRTHNQRMVIGFTVLFAGSHPRQMRSGVAPKGLTPGSPLSSIQGGVFFAFLETGEAN